MVKIRLKRLGRKSRPFYRIVVTDIRNRRDGVPMAELGFYNPLTKELKLDKSVALEWISKGAAPSDIVKRLIDKAPESGELVTLERRAPKPSAKAAAKASAEAEAAAPAEEAPAAE
jgi:small subunit ribosomal protein S16